MMRIGEAAARLGLATHVLRHWEDCGVIVPERTSTGHRIYTEEDVTRCQVVLACQSVGMSLADISLVLDRSAAGRTPVIVAKIADIRRQQRALTASAAFLTHVLECRHDLMSRCPECSEYAEDQPSAT